VKTRLLIDYPDGTFVLTSDHPNALRDVLRLLRDIEARVDRTRMLLDDDGERHYLNTAHVDRVDFTWEPPADAPAEPTPVEQREPVAV